MATKQKLTFPIVWDEKSARRGSHSASPSRSLDLREVYVSLGIDLPQCNGEPPGSCRFPAVRRRWRGHRALGRSRTSITSTAPNPNPPSRSCAASLQPEATPQEQGETSTWSSVSARCPRSRPTTCGASSVPRSTKTPALPGKTAQPAPRRADLDRGPAPARRPAVPPRRRQLSRHPGRDGGARPGDEPHLGEFRPHRLPAGPQCRLSDRPAARAGRRRRRRLDGVDALLVHGRVSARCGRTPRAASGRPC